MPPVQELTQVELNQVLAAAVKDLVIPILTASRPGHCLRISSLSEPVMHQLCNELNTIGLNADIVYILSPHQKAEMPWQITTAHLIELRNAENRALLAFIPPGLKAAAEDSFDISTFHEINLGALPGKILQNLRKQLTDDLRGMVDRVISYMRQEGKVESQDLIRYYLTLLKNNNELETAGGAIYQLGLVPDFALYQNPSLIEVRLARNLESCRILKDSDVLLLARIHNLRLLVNSLQGDLYRYLRSKRVPDIRGWGSELANDPALHRLCFDQWPFEGELPNHKILIFVEELGLKARDENSPIGSDNPPYLDVIRAPSIKISWTTDPKPNLVPDIKYFRIEIISTDGDLVSWESKNIAVSSSSKKINVKEFRDSVEDGLYYFRVRAYSEGGELLNFEDPEENSRVLRDPYNPGGKRINTSEDIWFWKDPHGEPPPVEAARNVTVNSFLDAQLQVRFAALDRDTDPFDPNLHPNPERTGWFASKGKSAEASYQIVFDAQTKFTLPISSLLRRIENDTLSKPENLGRWRLNFGEGKTHQTVEPVERQFHNRSQVPAAFMQARARLFTAIQSGSQNLLVETVDLTNFSDLIQAYADAYEAWLEATIAEFDQTVIMDEAGRRRTEAVLLDIDTIQVEIPNDSPLNDRVYVIAPTHPLRLLWHLQRSLLARSWLEQAKQSGNAKTALTSGLRNFLRCDLAPMNLPPFLRPTHDSFSYRVSRFYIEQGPLTPFWSLYMPEDVQDRRALVARVKRALAINRSSVETGAVGGIDRNILAQKIQRYLIQHPYIQTLKINAFNPGDAVLLVDAILKIEKERLKIKLPGLRYELRLFTQGSLLDDIGEAIEDLVNPERQVSPEADAFSSPSKNHLFPKLRFYRNHIDDFLENHELYQAHISLLHDVFPLDIDVNPVLEGRSSFLHGLIQEPITAFGSEAQADYTWRRQLHPITCPGLVQNDQVCKSLAETLDLLAILQASVAIGKTAPDSRPTLHLRLGIKHKSLLNLVHKTSDWVFVIDRNLGLEYFDSGPTMGGAIYLLDFAPDFAGVDNDRLFLTTQVTEEITFLIRPALVERGLDRGEGIEIYILNLLRSLSGRLALKLLSAPNDVSGVLGLALGRLFLEQFGLLEDSIFIPLDSHIDLFTPSDQDNPLASEVSFKRSDLLLVSCDPENRTLYFNIIEVKLRSDLGDINAYLGLRQEIEGQLTDTEKHLRKQYDPHLQVQDRLDRQVKTHELIALLYFYLQRSQRYGLVSQEAGQGFAKFIQNLDLGYLVSVSGVGLIFDFGSQDMTSDEEHAGLIFYRIGRDYLQRLVDAGLRQDTMLQETHQPAAAISEALQIAEKRQEILLSSDMRKDVQYEQVRTAFRKSTGSKKPDPRVQAVQQNLPTSSDKLPQELEVEPAAKQVVPPPVQLPASPESEAKVPVAQLNVRTPQPPTPVILPPGEEVPLVGREKPKYDVLIGEATSSSQFGLIGKAGGKLLALDLNGTNTISLFGVQGGGKSYTVGTIVEMATQPLEGINHLPKPLATVIFHYHESQDYPPEFVSMIHPNEKESEIKALLQEYGANPAPLQDVLILTSAEKLSERRAEFPGMRIEPISFSSSELSFKDWRFLMGVGGNQMYMKQINLIMKQLRQGMTLDSLRQEIEASELSDQQKTIARIRLNFAAQFIDDDRMLSDILRPGRLIIVDLRDEFIDKDEALGLFVVMLNIFANAGQEQGFNKLIVFDEAHKYMDNPDLTTHIVDVIRQMRHQGVSVLIASQDPPSLPNAIIELSSMVVLHRFNSPQWLRHIQKSITALSDLTPQQLSALSPGEAYVWAAKATERIFTQKAVKIHFRPRLSQHGGSTKTAV